MLRVGFTENIMTGLIGELRNGCCEVLLGIRRDSFESFVEGLEEGGLEVFKFEEFDD